MQEHRSKTMLEQTHKSFATIAEKLLEPEEFRVLYSLRLHNNNEGTVFIVQNIDGGASSPRQADA